MNTSDDASVFVKPFSRAKDGKYAQVPKIQGQPTANVKEYNINNGSTSRGRFMPIFPVWGF